jgi:nucleotide-binding universal stress UspA family protein
LLVAVDGSTHSDRIVREGCELAKKLSAKIVLLYVSKFPELAEEYMEFGGRSPSSLRAEKYVEVAETVTSKLAEIIQTEQIPYEVVFETGNPAEKIVTIASDRRASMIILGLRGLHGFGKIRSLGSVSRSVIENAACPVLVVAGEEGER